MSFGAPIVNQGYYDVPICNQYSNKENRDKPIFVDDYNLNKKINVTINDNNAEYIVNQEPTRPLKSLYIESDKQTTKYYNDPIMLSSDANIPLVKKKEQTPYQNDGMIENFQGGGGDGYGDGYYNQGPNQGAYNGYINSGGKGVMMGNTYYPGYLNTQLMPNVNTLYWDTSEYGYTNYDYIPQEPQEPQEHLIVNQPVRQQVRQPENIMNILPQKDIIIEQLEDTEETKEENIEPKKNKKVKKMVRCEKKLDGCKNENKILWFIILVLALSVLFFVLKFYNLI